METTGYKIRRALKTLEMRKEALLQEFNDCLTKYPDEKKESPFFVMESVNLIEDKIAALQTAQSEYNNLVTVDVLGRPLPLTLAVKRAGSAGRAANLWRQAARTAGYTHGDGVRRNDEVHKASTLTPIQATNFAIEAEKFAGALRGAIAEGNSRTVDVKGLEPELLAE